MKRERERDSRLNGDSETFIRKGIIEVDVVRMRVTEPFVDIIPTYWVYDVNEASGSRSFTSVPRP